VLIYPSEIIGNILDRTRRDVRVLKGVSYYMIVTIRDIVRLPENPANDTGRNRSALLQTVFLQDRIPLLDAVEVLLVPVREAETLLVPFSVAGVAGW